MKMAATQKQIEAGKKFGLDLTNATRFQARRILANKLSAKNSEVEPELVLGARVSYKFAPRMGTIEAIKGYKGREIMVRWDGEDDRTSWVSARTLQVL